MKDLNLFAAYKSGVAKSSSAKLPVIIIIIFVMIIGSVYGFLFVLDMTYKSSITSIKRELSLPDVVETQAKLTKAVRKNELLVSYNATLTLAKKSFDKSLIIDSSLIGKISASVPASVKISTLIVNPQTVTITCSATDAYAPASFTQSLKTKELFSSITYTGVTKDDKNNYLFELSCTFKEGITK